MYNLSTVMKFEIIRTLKKKSFWIMALAFPVAIVAIFGIIYFSNQATDQASKDTSKQQFSIEVKDDSGLVDPGLLESAGAKPAMTKAIGISNVKQGKVDAFIYYPKDLAHNKVQVYARDVGLFDNGRYQGVSKSLLQQSVSSQVDSSLRLVLSGGVNYQTTTFKDGQAYNGIAHLIVPAVFLLLFYFVIAMFGNQMLASTTEEKENRVIEMLLTTVRARTLIIGKIISLVILGLIQALIIVLPIAIIYALLHDKLSLPGLDISSLPFDWYRVILGFVLFIVCFLLFTGLLVTIGAAMPTAKEAGGFFGVVMVLIFGPLYAAPLFVSSPDSPVVQFLSYFPFTAPIPLLLRNAVGNLSLIEALISIAILCITAVIVLRIAVRVFSFGALEYSRKLSLKEIFRRTA